MEIITYVFMASAVVLLCIIAYKVDGLATMLQLKNESQIKFLTALAKAKKDEKKPIEKAEDKTEKKPAKKAERDTAKKPIAKRPSVYGEVWKILVEPHPYLRERLLTERYEISNMGRVWDKKRNCLIAPIAEMGQLKVRFKTQNSCSKRVLAVIVATTFIGIQNTCKYHVVHCDGNIKNCAATNLRWTPKDLGRKEAY